jgi:hypothetical protein
MSYIDYFESRENDLSGYIDYLSYITSDTQMYNEIYELWEAIKQAAQTASNGLIRLASTGYAIQTVSGEEGAVATAVATDDLYFKVFDLICPMYYSLDTVREIDGDSSEKNLIEPDTEIEIGISASGTLNLARIRPRIRTGIDAYLELIVNRNTNDSFARFDILAEASNEPADT